MSGTVEIRIVVDAPLVQYFEDGIRKDHLAVSVEEELVQFLATLLGETNYPMSSRKVGEKEIHLGYRPKAFADPIF